MKKHILLAFALLLSVMGTGLLSSCNASKNVLYFQDLTPDSSRIPLPAEQVITVRPEDKLSIIVNSRDQQLVSLFNLPTASKTIRSVQASSGSGSYSGGSSQGIAAYTVDSKGNIDFPVLGNIHVAGLTREQIARLIKDKLSSSHLVKDPVVTVEFQNLCIAVMGEVNSPGRFSIDRDHLTILDALSMAGDLTIYGNRHKVMVLRREGDEQRVYGINLTDAASLSASPAYYLRQDDVVYVEPNSMRARQSTVNGNTVASTSFWFSLISLVSSLSVLIFK